MFGERPLHLMLGPDDFPYKRVLNEDPATAMEKLTGFPLINTSGLQPDNRFFPDSERSSKVIHDRLRDRLQTILATDVTLARDLAYFGENKLELICQAYDLEPEEVLERLEEENFSLLVKTYRKDMDKDVNGMLRARSKLMVDAQLDAMHEIVMNKSEKASDRVRAFMAMTQIADAVPRNERGEGNQPGAAANIYFNFGDNSPFKPSLKQVSEKAVVIDMESDNG